MEVVRAAGGVVLRDDRVLLVHRPRYDDWTLPKGKAYEGESDEETAVREVREETAVRPELVRELPSTEYVDSRGRPKRVRYWLMRALEERGFEPNEEIDELRWASPEEAEGLLSYPRDLAPLRAAVAPLQIVVLRHARAGERDEWEGDDRLRPLDEKGFGQAEQLVEPLLGLGVRRVVSSPYLRCTQTVEPIARALHVSMQLADELAEGAARRETLRLLESVREPTVFCTHGDVVENVLDESLKKGAAAVLTREGLEFRREGGLRG